MSVLAIGLLLAVQLAGLLLVPFGLPGLWLMAGAALVYHFARGPEELPLATVGGFALVALVSEALDLVVTARFTRKYGGSRRAAWGAVIGGIAGAIVGVPVPLVGSVLGAFAGCFVGAWIAEATRGSAPGAVNRVATGALLGRAVAVALKVAAGLAIMIWTAWVVLS